MDTLTVARIVVTSVSGGLIAGLVLAGLVLADRLVTRENAIDWQRAYDEIRQIADQWREILAAYETELWRQREDNARLRTMVEQVEALAETMDPTFKRSHPPVS